MPIVVCDSSILILISKLEMLDLLIDVFGTIYIPRAVYIESVERGKKLKKIDAFSIENKIKEGKIVFEELKNFNEKENLSNNFNIHDGEAEALAFYLEKKADLFGTDDFRTLKTCKILNIRYFTTPIFLIRCYEKKKISKEKILLKFEKLKEFGWYKEDLIIDLKNRIENGGKKNG